MADTRVLLIRHGKHDSQGRHRQHSCAGLTAGGEWQAAALAARLAGDDSLHVHAVLASRAARTIQTAQAVADTLGLPLAESTCDLCEMHPGEAEGLTYDEMCERFGPNLSYVPGGEYFPEQAEPIQTDNTGITEWVCMLDDERRRGVWRLERHNDIAHLVAQPERAIAG